MAKFDPFAAQFFFDHDFVASANVARLALGRQGLDAFRQTKMVIIDHGPVIHGWRYPYDDGVFHPDAK